ncbi:MAG: hypothetical protein VYA34_04310 [Myxococcota bacterium]|nr:hypothetical protein [Myxococcota bacterium]
MTLMLAVFFVDNTPVWAGEKCAVFERTEDLDFDLDMNSGAPLDEFFEPAQRLYDELLRYDPYRLGCGKLQLVDAQRNIEYILGKLYLWRFEKTGAQADLMKSLSLLKRAVRSRRGGEARYLLGRAKVAYGWQKTPSSRAWALEIEGCRDMFEALSGKFGDNRRTVLAKLKDPLNIEGTTYPTHYLGQMKKQVRDTWKGVRVDYRDFERESKKLGPKVQVCLDEKKALMAWGAQLNAVMRAQGGMSRKLQGEVIKFQTQQAALRRKCGDVEAAFSKGGALTQSRNWVKATVKDLQRYEEPLRYLVWHGKLLQMMIVTAARYSTERNSRFVKPLDELIPLVRIVADHLALLGIKPRESFGGQERQGVSEEVRQMMAKGCDSEAPMDERIRLCRLAGEQARNALVATFYDDSNLASGAHRLMGLSMRERWENQLMAAENKPITEIAYEGVRKHLEKAIQMLGVTDYRSPRSSQGNEPEDSSLRREQLQDLLDKNNIRKSEIRLNLAEFEVKYSLGFVFETDVDGEVSVEVEKSPGDPQRYESVAETAFGQLRSIIKELNQTKPEFLKDRSDGECVEDPTGVQGLEVQRLIARSQARYGLLYANLIRKRLESGDKERILSMVNLIRIPFDFLERMELYLSFSRAARMDGLYAGEQVDKFLTAAVNSFLEQAKKPIPIWRPRREEMKEDGDDSCRVVAYDVGKHLPSTEVVGGTGELMRSHCAVLLDVFKALKKHSSNSLFEQSRSAILRVNSIPWASRPWTEELQCKDQDEYSCNEERKHCDELYEEYLEK